MSDLRTGAGLPGRPGRTTPDTIRRRMLDTALDLVRDQGMSVQIFGLHFDDVIGAAGVPRSSAYRIWSSKDLFFADLLDETAALATRQLSDRDALRLAVEIVASRPELHGTPDGRLHLIHEVIRVVLEQNYYATIDSFGWQSFLSLAAVVLTNKDGQSMRRVETTLREGGERFVAEMAAFHESVTSLLGFSLRNDFEGGYRLYAVLGSSMVEGLAIRHLSNPSVTDNFYHGLSTLSEERAEWAPSAIGFLAIFNQLLEADDRFDPASIPARLQELDCYARSDASLPHLAPPQP
jgi:AcrR family transcriptional regulator